MSIIWTIWDRLLQLFFPKLCRLCQTPLVMGEEQLCLRCLCDLPQTDYHKQTPNPLEQRLMGSCRIEHATAFLHFEKGGKVQALIHSLKYHDNPEMGYLLGRQFARILQADQSPLTQVDRLIPVPLHPSRKRKRGYNQSEWIARGIASVWGTEIDTHHLVRTSSNTTQTQKNVYDRWSNVDSIFQPRNPGALTNQHVLLIDDVVTTGATLATCAQSLSDIPGIRISLLALAIA